MNEDDIICPCTGVTARDVMDAVKNGANTVEDIEAATSAGTVCGACIQDLEALLAKLKTK
ncbi:MAG: (2Fe-2S)-binding protein [Lachnospiraceae bacterium]|nr:(2Fe-2S)-binding protein [Lachnospiraceae bacterium]